MKIISIGEVKRVEVLTGGELFVCQIGDRTTAAIKVAADVKEQRPTQRAIALSGDFPQIPESTLVSRPVITLVEPTLVPSSDPKHWHFEWGDRAAGNLILTKTGQLLVVTTGQMGDIVQINLEDGSFIDAPRDEMAVCTHWKIVHRPIGEGKYETVLDIS